MGNILKGKDILIIDDEQAMLDIVKAVLKREEASPIGIHSAEKGLKTAMTDSFDAIILDRHMPDGDGNEILKKLKSTDTTSHIPVIMLTGEKNAAEIKESLSIGAAGYILKPFKPVDFLRQLNKILDPDAMWGDDGSNEVKI